MINKKTYRLQLCLVFYLSVFMSVKTNAQNAQQQLLVKPFQNNVFIEEKGQFARNAQEFNAPFSEPVFYGVENAEFNAYFTARGIIFQFPERKKIKGWEEKEREEREREKGGKKEKDEKAVETIWHTATMTWQNSNPSVLVTAEDKTTDYYNYDNPSENNKTRYDFVPAFKKIKYTDLYPGIDVEFELPKEGGIKYKITVRPNTSVPDIAFRWEGLEKISLDEKGNIQLKSKYKAFGSKTVWSISDQAPTAFSSLSNKNIPVKYNVKNNLVAIKISADTTAFKEGFVIDPWITNTSFPDLNKAFDIQEDSLGNVIVIGNHSNWQVQKYDPNGALLWTYVTYASLMGDIAVDNPGNVYIVGGYSAGKRQKLDPAGVQLWQFSGLVEEWRLAFNYSKTILAEGGYFDSSPGNNLGRLDIATGAISDLMVYGEETRGLATDCNGDIYSLHVTFGYSGAGASNQLRKTNANFTAAGSLVNGFLLAEAQDASTAYGYNPAYSPQYTYQVLNAIVVNGPSVFIYDGLTLKQVDKATLTITNSVTVPNGVVTLCGGVTADKCGNVYVGSTVGIEKFNSSLTHLETISAPAAVYDLILNKDGDLLACGNGFLGRFSANCTAPPQLTATLSSTPASCKGGTVSAVAAGGTAPYSYLWQPGGYTTADVDSLSVGTYTCTITDPFCQVYTDTVSVAPLPPISITVGTIQKEACPNSFNGSANVNASGGTPPYNYHWNTTPVQNTQTATGLAAGIYLATVIDADSCWDTVSVIVTRNPNPVAAFSNTTVCKGDATVFTESSGSTSGTIVMHLWDFADGSPLNSNPNPQYTYAYSGTYAVTLMVYDNFGCGDTLTQPVTVHHLPVAGFSHIDVCHGTAMMFNSISTVNQSSTLSFYDWTFGDGATSVIQNPTHTYASAGTYSVSLITTTNNGCTDTIINSVVVHPIPDPVYTASNVCDGNFVTYNNLSTIAAPDAIQTSLWSFGDGTIMGNNTATHLYPSAGPYNTKLVVTSNFGCTDSITKTIVINPNPSVSFSAADTSGCAPLCISFQNNSGILSGNNVLSTWEFGDGSPASVSQDVFHCYSNSSHTATSSFTPTLTVVSDSGCVTSLSKQNYIVVYPNPLAEFTANPSVTTILDPVITITNLSQGAETYFWNLGDTTSIAVNLEPLTYSDTGTYQLFLITSTPYNCKDTAYQTIIIEPNFTFFVPNAFTPNDDGINDTFTGKGIFINTFEMSIFDRWGSLIYKTSDINKPWDGKANTGQEMAQMDVYVYSISVTDLKSKKYTFKGTVTLVR